MNKILEKLVGEVSHEVVMEKRKTWLKKKGFERIAEPVATIRIAPGIEMPITSDMGEVYKRKRPFPPLDFNEFPVFSTHRTLFLGRHLFLTKQEIRVGFKIYPRGSLISILGYSEHLTIK